MTTKPVTNMRVELECGHIVDCVSTRKDWTLQDMVGLKTHCAHCDGGKTIVRGIAANSMSLLVLAQRYHAENPGCWILTDRAVSEIVDVIRDATREQPRVGKMWWRAHQLVRYLGDRT